MTETIDLLDDLTDLTSSRPLFLQSSHNFVNARECDGCGEIRPDVDLFAEDCQTSEQLWLCLACGE